MKRRWLALIAAAGGMTLGAWAQDPTPAPEGSEAPPGPSPVRERFGRGDFRGGGPGGAMTDRWMQRLEETKPDEFARLRELREREPESFRTEARRFLRDELTQKIRREHPGVLEALQSLPEADREWLLSRVLGFEHGFRGNMGGGPPGPGGPGAQEPNTRGDEEEAQLSRIGSDYREAKTEQDRARIKSVLRAEVQTSFQRRHERRRKELDVMEAKLKEARAFLADRERNEAAIVDKRVDELIAPPPASPPPPPAENKARRPPTI